MTEVLTYSFLTWPQFLIFTAVMVVIILVVNRFHLFERHSWNTSIGYHMFFCIAITLIAIAFILAMPIVHLLFLWVIFGFIYKNLFAYIRSVYTLYFSKIHIGDRVRVGKTEGVLESINLGGMHVSGQEEKTFIGFNSWKKQELVLLSERGNVPVSFLVDGTETDKTSAEHISSLEKQLFEFPYLSNSPISIKDETEGIKGRVIISSNNYKESLNKNLQGAGFKLKENKS